MPDASEWMVGPPTRDTVDIKVSVGPDAEVSPRLRAALEQLAAVMADEAEVSGYFMVHDCGTYTVSCGSTYSCGQYHSVVEGGLPNPCAFHMGLIVGNG